MIDPEARATIEPIADHAIAWACACGQVSWLHHECCDRCGTPRPAPVAKPEPGHMTRAEKSAYMADVARHLIEAETAKDMAFFDGTQWTEQQRATMRLRGKLP